MKITITKRDFNQFYIYNYYYGTKRIVRYMRLYMGPVLLAVGLYLKFGYSKETNIFIIIFTLAYGLFYSLRPIFMIIAARAKDETFEYNIKNHNLHIKDRLNEGSISLKKYPLQNNDRYFFVRISNGQSIFFPKDKLDDVTIELFRKNLL